MADLARYLRRFRRLAAPPGRPGPMAVPADREAERSDELRDVFAAIDVIEAEVAGIGEEAALRADRLLAEAETRADRVLSAARGEAEEVRADAASRRRQDVDEEIASVTEEARAKADEVLERAERNLDVVAGRLVRGVLGVAGTDGEHHSGGEGNAA